MYTSFTATTLAALLSTCCLADIIDYKEEAPLQEMLDTYDYSLISAFKPSDPESVEINELLTGVEALFESKIASGEWAKRNVGWFRIDIEKFPQYALDKESTSQQMMVANDERGIRKKLGLQKHYEKPEQNIELFANVVRELTGDWVTEIDCDDIQKEGRKFYDEVVYFGAKEDILPGGQSEAMNDLAMIDTYRYMDSRVGFHYNEKKSCKKEFNLDPKKTYIVFFSGEAQPQIMTVNEDYISLEMMLFTLNTSAVKGTPQWGQRAFTTLFEMNQNAVVYYMPEGETMDSIRQDWRVMLMAKLNEWMQANHAQFIPLVQTWEADSLPSLLVPPLREVIKVESQGELPHLFIYHSFSDSVVRYPDIMHDIEKFSPELVMFWAQIQVHEKEISMLRDKLAEHEGANEGDEKKLTDEKVKQITDMLKEKNEELVELRNMHETTKQELAEENIFAKFAKRALSVGNGDAPEEEKEETPAAKAEVKSEEL